MSNMTIKNRSATSGIKVLLLLLLPAAGLLTGGCSQPNPGNTEETSQTGTEVKTSGPISQPDSSKAEVLVLDESKSEQELRNPWSPDGIEDFVLIERSGKKVTKADLLGKPWVACFIFTNCVGPCLNISKQMHELQDWVKNTDVRLVSFSVDPQNDTPERLRAYADILAADKDRWLFLTGDKETIYRLVRKDFKTTAVESTAGPIHTSNIFHIDEQGRIIGKYNAVKEDEIAELRRVLQKGSTRKTQPVPAEKPPRENASQSSEGR